MRTIFISLMLCLMPVAAYSQVFDSLIGHKICWSNGRTSVFLPNGDYVEGGKKFGSWAHLAGDTIDWSNNRTGRGPVEFTQEGSAIVIKWANRSLTGKLCK
ncbi:MAG: hypothetical protein KGM15_10465 [Pseudomonadota bacterium]|nr:hypothetical protein [Pseudomonadota bacterium]